MYIHSLAHSPTQTYGGRLPEMKEKQTKSQEESTRTGQRVALIERVHFDVAIIVTAAVSGN